MDHLLYGCAYYDEYMPYERLDKDLAMMKKAGINVIRIAESTWSTEEPEDGVFDFSHVTKVLEACEREKIHVIIGTPTYAIPAWMAKKYPDIMVTDKSGRRPYGARQIMDITDQAGDLPVLGPPGKNGKGIQIRVEILIRLLNPHKPLDRAGVHHNLIVQGLFNL